MRRCSWAALVAALATLAASLVGSAPPGPDAALIAVAGELALEFPQNASVFVSDERPRLVVGSRPGVEWDARLRLAYRIWGMHGGDVDVFAEHPMAELFPVSSDEPAGERMYTEVYFSGPAGEYEARVVLSLVPAAEDEEDVDADGGSGEDMSMRVDVWSDTVRFSVAESGDTAAEVPHSAAPAGGGRAASGGEQRWGVYFDYPPTAVYDFGEEEPRVTFRVEGDFGEEHTANVYLDGRFVTQASTPKATICMSTIPFDDGVTYNVSVEIVEPQGHVSRTGSVLFTAAESRPNEIAVCIISPSNCVSHRDLDLPDPDSAPPPPARAHARQGEQDGACDKEEVRRSGSWPGGDKRCRGGAEGRGNGGGGRGPEYIGWQRVLNLHELPRRRAGEISKHASSNAPLHSMPDFSNFLRAEDGELILMDDFGPGCVYRIFMPVVRFI